MDGQVPRDGAPAYSYRILDHWDNLDDTVERGYAGHSIWGWTSEEFPSGRIAQYGALNQKIGINGIVLNNVNASPEVLDHAHLLRVGKIADILRHYGIKVYLSVNFASPMHVGAGADSTILSTADPLDKRVRKWWNDKTAEIYEIVPDFGGFLVKASSEGQPGPQDFGRSHVDGANLLASALADHGGIVMWRAFVYSADSPDRAMQAYDEFMPFDGKFADNVAIQVKNGPIDFQPREPFSPLFGGMRRTSLAPELQITQEYLGQGNHSVFLAPMWKEFLDSDTYRDGPGSLVSRVSGPIIAGVANVGQDENWCGNIFAQANWYAFGRLAWDPSLSSDQIAEEWLRMTFPCPLFISKRRFTEKFIEPVKDMMLSSWETCIDYMMPLGLHHIFAWGHHYGPEPWCDIPGARPDWLPSYYHKADSIGLGFDRTLDGSAAVLQYNDPFCTRVDDIRTCPEKYLLWFHHVPWNFRLRSGNTLWVELCERYDRGVKAARDNVRLWESVKIYVDRDRWNSIYEKLKIQAQDAAWWRDACLQYFAEFSGMPYPEDIEKPQVPLDSLKRIHLDMTHHN
ncbi:MAG: alpha-glucuronidase [Bacteroidota bacterium]|nr:alpha-glucuronidase [Bacteroidota bacterium]